MMLNILMISPQFRPIVGGYERAAERLSSALARRGHAVTILTERRQPSWPAQEERDGVLVQRWWCIYRSGLHTLTSMLSLAVQLFWRGRAFQVWHVHQYGMAASVSIALALLLRRPVILKLTNTADQGLARTLASERFSRLTSYLHRRVHAVVALTRAGAAEAETFGIAPKRIQVFGNGIETAAFRPRSDVERRDLKRELGIQAGRLVLFVGRLAAEKNVAGLLQAWALAQPRLDADWRLAIVGDGPLRQELEQLAGALNVRDTVLFTGIQTDVAAWLGAADLFVLSSHHEGMSNTLLEAMATGLPVVMTQVSGSTELVEETGSGLVAPVGDMPRLAEALVELASRPEDRAAMGLRAREVIQRRYSIEHIAAQHEMLYESLAAEAGPLR